MLVSVCYGDRSVCSILSPILSGEWVPLGFSRRLSLFCSWHLGCVYCVFCCWRYVVPILSPAHGGGGCCMFGRCVPGFVFQLGWLQDIAFCFSFLFAPSYCLWRLVFPLSSLTVFLVSWVLPVLADSVCLGPAFLLYRVCFCFRVLFFVRLPVCFRDAVLSVARYLVC